MKEYSNGGGDWLYYLNYGTIYRFASALLQIQELRGVNITACQTSVRPRSTDLSAQICRWDSGNDYLNEVTTGIVNFLLIETYLFMTIFIQVYKESEWKDSTPWLNLGLCLAFVAATTVVTLLLYVIPMPHCIKRKFRYK